MWLELGFLGFGLLILLLSFSDRQKTGTQLPVESLSSLPLPVEQHPEKTEVSDNDSFIMIHKLTIRKTQKEELTEKKPDIVTLQPKSRKMSPADLLREKKDKQNATALTGSLTSRTKWKGDLDKMRKKRVVRVLVPFSRTFFFPDKGRKRGLIYDGLMEYEKYLNKQVKGNKHLPVQVMVIPTAHNRLFSDLNAGYGDIVAANLTITPKRKKQVDFSAPLLTGVREIIVTGSGVSLMKSIFELAGKDIIVRKSSSYNESILALNRTLISIGKKPLRIIYVDEYLEDEDLLEMVNAGLVPMIAIDSHKGEFWAGIFKDIKLHPDVKLRTGGEIAWAIRPNSPQLKKSINGFVRGNKKGSLMDNMLFQAYLKSNKYIHHELSDESMRDYKQTIKLFKTYGDKYDFPYLLLTALAYQESGLDNRKRSHAGAVGIMQVLPATASSRHVAIVNISRLENNIHAGTRYLRSMADRYFSDPELSPLNRDLFTLAAYNSGPEKVVSLRKEATKQGYDANIWFNNVEAVAAANTGRETVQYVRNIYKYFVAYEYITRREQMKKVGTTLLKSHYGDK